MLGGIVEVASEGQSLSVHRGFLEANGEDGKARVPLDQLEALILTARSCALSRSLISALGRRGIPVVVSGANYEPEAMVLPVQAGANVAGHPLDQAALTPGRRKRLWQAVVRQKLTNQATVLKSAEVVKVSQRLSSLAARVKPGDPDNFEASGARSYFPALFGKGFVRERGSPGINGQLNYGYAVLRACCARSLVAVGLSPALGLHHQSRRNPLCLADDLVELFRPALDWLVWSTSANPHAELTPETKRHLAQALLVEMEHEGTSVTLVRAIQRAAHGYAKALADASTEWPLPLLPLTPRIARA